MTHFRLLKAQKKHPLRQQHHNKQTLLLQFISGSELLQVCCGCLFATVAKISDSCKNFQGTCSCLERLQEHLQILQLQICRMHNIMCKNSVNQALCV